MYTELMIQTPKLFLITHSTTTLFPLTNSLMLLRVMNFYFTNSTAYSYSICLCYIIKKSCKIFIYLKCIKLKKAEYIEYSAVKNVFAPFLIS